MERLKSLREIVKGKENEDIYIIFERFDPDAAASSVALSFLIDNNLRVEGDKGKTHIYGPLETGFRSGKAIINRYNLKADIKPLEDIPEEVDNVALVDSNTLDDDRTPNSVINKKPIIVIDHHKGEADYNKDDIFYWVDANIGAASTLLVELIQESGAELNEKNGSVAPLLAMGIITDTKDKAMSERDKNALDWIKGFTTEAELSQFDNPPKPEEYFQRMSKALNNYKRKGSRLVTGVGFVSAASSDDLAEIADFLLVMEGVTLLVVWGIDKDEKRVIGKARSSDLSTHLEEFLKDKFGPHSGAKLSPDGRGEGGFSINLDLNLLIPGTEEETVSLVKKFMETMVFSEEYKFEEAE